MPAQDHLGGGAVQAFGDGLDGGGGEGFAATEGRPALGDDAARGVGGAEGRLLKLGMEFDLVQHRGDAGFSCEAVDLFGVEVRGADGGDCAFVPQLDQCAPCVNVLVTGGAGPVDEAQIKPVQRQTLKAFRYGLLSAGIALAIVPDFGGDENVVTRDARGADALAHADLVAINRSAVHQAVAHLQGVSSDAGGVGDLPQAEAQLRDGVGVVEGEGLHFFGGPFGGRMLKIRGVLALNPSFEFQTYHRH